jgi:hypothetical protein
MRIDYAAVDLPAVGTTMPLMGRHSNSRLILIGGYIQQPFQIAEGIAGSTTATVLYFSRQVYLGFYIAAATLGRRAR